MPKYTVGQTYKAAYWDGVMNSFEVLEIGCIFYGIRWADGTEEWAYEADMDRWTEAAREKEMEEAYK